MSCTGCVNSVKQALLQIPGVKAADVQLSPQSAVLLVDKPVDIADLQSGLNQAGAYTIKERQP